MQVQNSNFFEECPQMQNQIFESYETDDDMSYSTYGLLEVAEESGEEFQENHDIPMDDAKNYSNWELVNILRENADSEEPDVALATLFKCSSSKSNSITLSQVPYTLFKKLETTPGYDFNFVSGYFHQDMPLDQFVGLCIITKL